MKLTEISQPAQPLIDGYGPGGFRIGGTWHDGSLLLAPERIERITLPFGPEVVAAVCALADEIDVLLVGQGADIAALGPEVRTPLEDAGLGVEIMSTASACRTYNVLLAEERRVGALLAAI